MILLTHNQMFNRKYKKDLDNYYTYKYLLFKHLTVMRKELLIVISHKDNEKTNVNMIELRADR